MPYLFDGNNLLGAILSNDELFAPVTDVELCRAISDYLRAMRDEGDMVFDGMGPPNKAAFYGLPSLHVSFAGLGTDADSIIESKIHMIAKPKQLVVVSDDRRLRGAARRKRAQSLRCVAFWQRVWSFQNRRPARPDPPGKHHGLNHRETEKWMQAFGFKPKTTEEKT